jgi:2-phosphoglycerate kinase
MPPRDFAADLICGAGDATDATVAEAARDSDLPEQQKHVANWNAILIPGNPGSGKASLASELARRGCAAIDADDLAG